MKLGPLNARCVRSERQNGPPVLLVHGIGLGAWIWERDQRLLANAGLTSWAVDLPGHDGPPTSSMEDCYRAVAEAGLEVGRDVSVIAYDGIPEGAYATPQLTTFEVDSREAGARLAHLLIRRIRGEAPEDLRETAHARLRLRASDGPPSMTSEELRERLSRATTRV